MLRNRCSGQGVTVHNSALTRHQPGTHTRAGCTPHTPWYWEHSVLQNSCCVHCLVGACAPFDAASAWLLCVAGCLPCPALLSIPGWAPPCHHCQPHHSARHSRLAPPVSRASACMPAQQRLHAHTPTAPPWPRPAHHLPPPPQPTGALGAAGWTCPLANLRASLASCAPRGPGG